MASVCQGFGLLLQMLLEFVRKITNFCAINFGLGERLFEPRKERFEKPLSKKLKAN